MYEYLEGTLSELNPTYAVIDCSGVGYLLSISLQTFSQIEGKQKVKLYTHFVVREDVQQFYGFATKTEREHFRLLISVSGVGGGTARMILSTYQSRELANIISSENATLLKNVKGLGMKTAQKIIVELKDKIVGEGHEPLSVTMSGGAGQEIYEEAIAALTMLGFARNNSDKVLRAIIKDEPTLGVEQVIRQALKKM